MGGNDIYMCRNPDLLSDVGYWLHWDGTGHLQQRRVSQVPELLLTGTGKLMLICCQRPSYYLPIQHQDLIPRW